MALTISDAGNGVSTGTGPTVATGGTVTAAIGDWLVVFVSASNAGLNGASSIASITDVPGNTYTQRAIINYDPGLANNGHTLGIFTAKITAALSSAVVTCNLSPDTPQKSIQVYRVQPSAAHLVNFVATDTTGLTGLPTSHTAPTVSVASGNTIFGAAAIETDDAITGDSDTTNGSWSAVITRLADGGADANTSSVVSQYKTVNATGNQDWACTTASGRNSARTYLVINELNAYAVAADAGSYAITGADATLTLGEAALSIAADVGAYSLTGEDAGLKVARRVSADAGSYALAGTDAALRSSRRLVAGDGSYALAGTDAALELGGGLNDYTLAADAGSYSHAGSDAALKVSRKIVADAGAYALTGLDAALRTARQIVAGEGLYSLIGADVALKTVLRIAAGVGSYALTGSPANIRRAAIPSLVHGGIFVMPVLVADEPVTRAYISGAVTPNGIPQ